MTYSLNLRNLDFERAVARHGEPPTITVDKRGANPAVLQAIDADLQTSVKIRQNTYLNDIVGQDPRAIKRIIKPMMGYRNFRCARVILSGIEMMHRVRKGQVKDAGIGRTVAGQFYSLIM